MTYWIIVYMSLVSIYNVDYSTDCKYKILSRPVNVVFKTERELLKKYDSLSSEEQDTVRIFKGKEFETTERKYDLRYILREKNRVMNHNETSRHR